MRERMGDGYGGYGGDGGYGRPMGGDMGAPRGPDMYGGSMYDRRGMPPTASAYGAPAQAAAPPPRSDMGVYGAPAAMPQQRAGKCNRFFLMV